MSTKSGRCGVSFTAPIVLQTSALHALELSPQQKPQRAATPTPRQRRQRVQVPVCSAKEKMAGEKVLANADGSPRLHVVFVHPQIHWNTGNIGRTCLGLGAELHLVRPLGFSLDAAQVRRAGLDYWEHVRISVYESWDEFVGGRLHELGGTRLFFTKFGTECASEMRWPETGNVVMVFGSEVDGFNGIRSWLEGPGREERCVSFPMVDDRFRSFNLSTTASMALWDAYKQLKVADCTATSVADMPDIAGAHGSGRSALGVTEASA